jgi:hypothetical protein
VDRENFTLLRSCKEGVWNDWTFREAMNEENHRKKKEKLRSMIMIIGKDDMGREYGTSFVGET